MCRVTSRPLHIASDESRCSADLLAPLATRRYELFRMDCPTTPLRRLSAARFYGPLERSWRITDSIMKRVYFSSRDGK